MILKLLLIALLFVTILRSESLKDINDIVELVRQGDRQIERGKILLAIDYYEKAYFSGAGSAKFLNRLSLMYLETEQFNKAIEMLRASLVEEPSQVNLYSHIGDAYLALGNLDSAIVSVGLAHKLMPQSSAVHSALALLLIKSGSTEKAKAHLDTSVMLDSSNAEAHRLLGFYFAQMDSVDNAIKHYENLAKLVPDNFESFNNIAFLQAARREYVSALEYYEKAKNRVRDPIILSAIVDNMEAVSALIDGKMRARYILVSSESIASEILTKLANGEEFANLARKYSIAPNATDGGDLGYFGNGELLPEFEETVVNMVIGEYSDILIMNMGYVVIQRLN